MAVEFNFAKEARDKAWRNLGSEQATFSNAVGGKKS